MPRKTDAPGGATTPRQFRLSDATLATIDALAQSYQSDPAIKVTRTDVLNIAVRELARRRLNLKHPAPI